MLETKPLMHRALMDIQPPDYCRATLSLTLTPIKAASSAPSTFKVHLECTHFSPLHCCSCLGPLVSHLHPCSLPAPTLLSVSISSTQHLLTGWSEQVTLCSEPNNASLLLRAETKSFPVAQRLCMSWPLL